MNPASILLVDDDAQSLESTRKILELEGHRVDIARDGMEALAKLQPLGSKNYALVISDVRMPKMTGLEFLKALTISKQKIPVILMTAFGRVDDAVDAMKLGAIDFLQKPFKRQALLDAVKSALERIRASTTVPTGATAASAAGFKSDKEGLASILGSSSRIQVIRQMIAQVAPTSATVLILGESGTGKERVARAVHCVSTRAEKPFIAVNCAAIPDTLLESELFGYERGAFTGANSSKMGLFEAAHGGTLLLDEIGDMPLTLQAKLLRILQDGEVRRLGASSSKKVDVRLIAATHRDLKAAVAAGAFRQDLLFRLEVVQLPLPALRDRLEDLPEFAIELLARANLRHKKSIRAISKDAYRVLSSYAWPGNIRELENVIERAVIFATSDEIRPEDLPSHLSELAGKDLGLLSPLSTIPIPIGTPLKDVEEILIRKTLELTQGDKNITAKLLGINSRTIYRKLKEEGGPEADETP